MDRARYDRLTILFHWVMAALIFYAAAAILIADDLPRGAFRDLIKTSHNSVGALVVARMLAREDVQGQVLGASRALVNRLLPATAD